MRKWNLYYADPELNAKNNGEPVGTYFAETSNEAANMWPDPKDECVAIRVEDAGSAYSEEGEHLYNLAKGRSTVGIELAKNHLLILAKMRGLDTDWMSDYYVTGHVNPRWYKDGTMNKAYMVCGKICGIDARGWPTRRDHKFLALRLFIDKIFRK